MTTIIETRGLDKLRAFFADMSDRVSQAEVLAVNRGADRAQARGSRDIRSQVAFSAKYLREASNDGKPRLGIIRRATAESPEAIIRGRDRPTSVAQFVKGGREPGRRKPTVEVAPGAAKRMPSAWLVRLKRGDLLDNGNFNVGLAIRLPKGATLNKKIFSKPFGRGAYLLYGPSVGQVFRDVAANMEGDIAEAVADEFIRQFERL